MKIEILNDIGHVRILGFLFIRFGLGSKDNS